MLTNTFGCVRFVYNKMLDERQANLTVGRPLTYVQSSALLTKWKRSDQSLAFLNQVPAIPLQQTLRHLDLAFKRSGRKITRPPVYKRLRGRQAAEFTRSAFTFQNGNLKLAKMPRPLNIRWSQPLPDGAMPFTVTVSRDPANRWFVSLRCDVNVVELETSMNAVGVDLGITTLATLSTGEKIQNPRHEKRDRRALARASHRLSKKQKGSSNQAKARVKVARIHARIADRRRDHLHKLTTRLVRENQTIVIERLTVNGMRRNRRLAKAISDASWATLRGQLEYKSAWYGRELIIMDRWYPSSKTCSNCGDINPVLTLAVRVWTCSCGTHHDRDVNAAKNLLAAGRAVAARGEGVRPSRQQSPTTTLPFVKQEGP